MSALVAHGVAWLAGRDDFPNLAAVAKVTATREITRLGSTRIKRGGWLLQVLPAA